MALTIKCSREKTWEFEQLVRKGHVTRRVNKLCILPPPRRGPPHDTGPEKQVMRVRVLGGRYVAETENRYILVYPFMHRWVGSQKHVQTRSRARAQEARPRTLNLVSSGNQKKINTNTWLTAG